MGLFWDVFLLKVDRILLLAYIQVSLNKFKRNRHQPNVKRLPLDRPSLFFIGLSLKLNAKPSVEARVLLPPKSKPPILFDVWAPKLKEPLSESLEVLPKLNMLLLLSSAPPNMEKPPPSVLDTLGEGFANPKLKPVSDGAVTLKSVLPKLKLALFVDAELLNANSVFSFVVSLAVKDSSRELLFATTSVSVPVTICCSLVPAEFGTSASFTPPSTSVGSKDTIWWPYIYKIIFISSHCINIATSLSF